MCASEPQDVLRPLLFRCHCMLPPKRHIIPRQNKGEPAAVFVQLKPAAAATTIAPFELLPLQTFANFGNHPSKLLPVLPRYHFNRGRQSAHVQGPQHHTAVTFAARQELNARDRVPVVQSGWQLCSGLARSSGGTCPATASSKLLLCLPCALFA